MTSQFSRRKILGAAGNLAALSCIGMDNAEGASVTYLLGYTDKNTYYPGDVVQLRMNPTLNPRAVGTIYSAPVTTGWRLIRMHDGAVVDSGTVTVQPSVIAPANQDQNWPLTKALTLSSTISAGLYHFVCDQSSYQVGAYFCVLPSAKSEMLVILPTNTFHAYNYYGGQSMYAYNSNNGINATKVSFNRPMGIPFYLALDDGLNDFFIWLKNNYSCDIATDRDLHNNPYLLQGYKCVIPVGHGEYWSRPMRNNLETYLRAGGNVANFSGNTIWWCVRYEDAGNSMYCARVVDPSVDPNQADPAILWHFKGWSAKSQLGCGFEHGAASPDGGVNAIKPAPAKVFNEDHWIYQNANVKNGNIIGIQEKLATYEVDGVDLEWVSNTPRVKVNSGTHSSFVILSTSDVSTWSLSPPKNWTMGYMKNQYGGMVFNGATTDWHHAFSARYTPTTFNSPFVTMTRNFLNACTNMQIIEFKTPNPVKDPLNLSGVNGYSYMYLTEAAIAQLYPTAQNNIRSVYAANAIWTETGARINLPLSSRPGAVPLYKHSTSVKQPGSRFTVYKEILTTSSTVQSSSWVNQGIVGYVFTTNVVNSKPVHLFSDAGVLGSSARFSVVNSKTGRETYSGVPFYSY